MIEVHWNPVWRLGPIPVNWYGLGWAAAFIVGAKRDRLLLDGAFGNVRAAIALRAMLSELGMSRVPSIFPIPKVQDAFREDGSPIDEGYERRIVKFLDELEWYARALKGGSGTRPRPRAEQLLGAAVDRVVTVS
ncbi:MAG: hypothetical protein M3495_02810 [Pseudomonadota bacterium]|nr:hypothetical protein [Pseudomonadota bacterium]